MSPINHNISLLWAITQIERGEWKQTSSNNNNKQKEEKTKPVHEPERIHLRWLEHVHMNINNHELIKYQVQSKEK